jgi:ABC-type nitrate/sulfonate/bicarbonate transport system substrate-binding protein
LRGDDDGTLGIGRRGLLGGVLALAGLGPAGAQALRKLTFVTPFGYLVSFAPDLVGKAGGYFEREGLDVTIQSARGSAQGMQQVLSSQALMTRIGGADVMKAIANDDAPVVAVATIGQGSPFFVISRQTAPVRSPKEMPGKVIGVISKGGGSENLLDAMLAEAGVDPGTVKREAVGDSPGAFALIEAGRLNAFIGAIGTLIGLKGTGAPIEYFSTDDFAPMPGQVYIAARDAVAKDPDRIVRYLRGVKQAIDAMLADATLEHTLDLLANFEIAAMRDRAVAKADLEANKALWLSAGKDHLLRNVPRRWQRGRDLLAKVGVVKPGPAADFYTNALVDQALR